MSDAYKIGVTVVMSNLVSAELLKIISQFGLAEKSALGFAGKLGLVSAAAIGVAAVLKSGVEEAAKFQTEAAKFASLGFGDGVNAQAQKFAMGMKTLGTSATENMSLVADAMAVFKDLGHAEMVAPLLAKMKFANSALYGSEGGSRDSKFMDMLKVIEFRGGLKSEAEFATQADFVQKVINGSRNRVDASQLLQALKTGGVSLAGQTNEAFYLGSEPLIQEFGGQRFGTGNMSIYQNLVQMRTTQAALTEMMRLGLLDSSKVEMNGVTGQVKKAQAGAFRNSEVLTQRGVLAFLDEVLLPAFKSHGITKDDDVIMELGRILTNRTGSSLLSRVYQQRASLYNQQDANKNALGMDASAAAADKTFAGKVIEFNAHWKTFETQVGDVFLPVAIKALDGLTSFVKWLSQIGEVIGKQVYEAEQAWNNPLNPLHHPINFLNSVFGHSDTSQFGKSFGAFTGVGHYGGVVPPASKQSGVINTQVNLDGRVIAENTTKYQIQGMATMPSSGSLFDGRMNLAPVQ